MIGAQNTLGQKYWVGIVQWAPETSVLEEIADIFRNYDIDYHPVAEAAGGVRGWGTTNNRLNHLTHSGIHS